MRTRRRELLCAGLIGVCGLGATRVRAQAGVVDLNGSRAMAQLPTPDAGPARSWRHSSDQLVNLELHHTALKDALRAVAREAEVQLIYNDRDLPSDWTVSVVIADATVSQALGLVLHGTGLEARATAAGIVVERRAKAVAPEPRERQGSISGRVTDAETHEPIASATVRLEETTYATLTNGEGRYRIPNVPAGTYAITARQIGYQQITRTIVVAEDQDVAADLIMTPSPTILDQVVTTGTVIPTTVKALPTPVSVITADQIERQHPRTLPAILRQAVPTGVAFSNPGNPTATQISVRGASSLTGTGNMKIFVDGVEATYAAFTPVDPASIDRIEVVRGPQAATIYGADAAGGVIQIFTKRGQSATHPRVEAQVAAGLQQTPYADFKAVARQQYSGSLYGGGEGMNYTFGGGYSHLADYLPNGEISRQSASSIYGGMHFSRSILGADLSARYYDNDAPLVVNPLLLTTGYVPASRPYYTNTGSINETIGARLTASPTTRWRNQLVVGIDRYTTQSAQARPRYTTPGDTLRSLTNYASRKVSLGYNTSITGTIGQAMTGSLTLGVDHYSQELDLLSTSRALNVTGSIQTSPSGLLRGSITRQTNTGYFAQAQLGLRDALFFTAGVRAEDNSTFGTDYGMPLLPRVGLTLVRGVGGTTVKVRASYGRALRTPTAGQATGTVTASSVQLANPLLAAEQQQGWDGGVDLVFGDRASLSLSGFIQRAKDLIAFMQVATAPLPTYQYQNIGEVSNRGLEVEGNVSVSTWLQLTAQYGYVRSRFESVGTSRGAVQVGDEPLGVPTHTAGAALTMTPREGTTLTAGLSYVGKFKQADFLAEYRCFASFDEPACPGSFLSTGSARAFTVRYPALAKIDVSVTQSVARDIEAFLTIDNLTNSQAYEGRSTVPVVGRNTMVGLHITL